MWSGRASVRALVRVEGIHKVISSQETVDGRQEWLPFTVRLYFYRGSDQIRLVHTFIYNGDEQRDMITSLGLRFSVPMRDEAYNRHIAFVTDAHRLRHRRWWCVGRASAASRRTA